MLSVGQGIIGSAAEENTRNRVNWEEGSSYFLPCSKGIACGWVHKRNEEYESNKKCETAEVDSQSEADDVVVYVLKVSLDAFHDMDENVPDVASLWVNKLYHLFSRCIKKLNTGNDKTSCGVESISRNRNTMEGILLTTEESLDIVNIVQLVEKQK